MTGRHGGIDPTWLLAGRNALYLSAPAHDQQRLRGLFAALIGTVVAAAFDRCSQTGRPIDPPLLLCLDEAANVAPLPNLSEIASTAPGQGVPPPEDARPGDELVLAEEGGVRVFYIAAATMPGLVERLALVLGEHIHDGAELHVTHNAMQSGWTNHPATRATCCARPSRHDECAVLEVQLSPRPATCRRPNRAARRGPRVVPAPKPRSRHAAERRRQASFRVAATAAAKFVCARGALAGLRG